jgi:hypothetical protein
MKHSPAPFELQITQSRKGVSHMLPPAQPLAHLSAAWQMRSVTLSHFLVSVTPDMQQAWTSDTSKL